MDPSAELAADDTVAMELAIAEARLAGADGDVPVGAVVVAGVVVVAKRHNERERSGDPAAHAELLALRDAAARFGRWRLPECTVVVTLEPCPMCAGALVAARVGPVRLIDNVAARPPGAAAPPAMQETPA